MPAETARPNHRTDASTRGPVLQRVDGRKLVRGKATLSDQGIMAMVWSPWNRRLRAAAVLT